jgi:hypothetical protein
VIPRLVTGSLLPSQKMRSLPIPPGWKGRAPPPPPTTDLSLLVEATTTPPACAGSFALAAASSRSYKLASISSSTRFQPTTDPSARPTAMCDKVGETASAETGAGRFGVGEMGAERRSVRCGDAVAAASTAAAAAAAAGGAGSVRSQILRIGNRLDGSSCGAGILARRVLPRGSGQGRDLRRRLRRWRVPVRGPSLATRRGGRGRRHSTASSFRSPSAR